MAACKQDMCCSVNYRFSKEDGSPSQELTDIRTRHILPVDLNSFLCRNARILSEFYQMLGHSTEASKYDQYVQEFTDAIDKVLWNVDRGAWFDYDTKLSQQRVYFYPSNVAPLWADCYPCVEIYNYTYMQSDSFSFTKLQTDSSKGQN